MRVSDESVTIADLLGWRASDYTTPFYSSVYGLENRGDVVKLLKELVSGKAACGITTWSGSCADGEVMDMSAAFCGGVETPGLISDLRIVLSDPTLLTTLKWVSADVADLDDLATVGLCPSEYQVWLRDGKKLCYMGGGELRFLSQARSGKCGVLPLHQLLWRDRSYAGITSAYYDDADRFIESLLSAKVSEMRISGTIDDLLESRDQLYELGADRFSVAEFTLNRSTTLGAPKL